MLDYIWTIAVVTIWLSAAVYDGYEYGHNQRAWPFFGLVSWALYAIWERPQLKETFDALREWLPQSESLISGFTALVIMSFAYLVLMMTVTVTANAVGHGLKKIHLYRQHKSKPHFNGYF